MENVKPNIISVHSATTSLGLKASEFSELIAQEKVGKVKNSRGKWAINMSDFKILKEKIKLSNEKEVVLTPEEKTVLLERKIVEFKNNLKSHIVVDPKPRSKKLDKSILFVGPTNSGKTYHGLNQLFHDYEQNPDEVHVYCGPLRLLAYEVYNKMGERYGYENVGFITGEEAINPEAKLLATTAEMAPSEGRSILIDEAHWLVEPNRGHVWTRLLYSHQYSNLYALTAAEAVPLIQELTKDAYYSDMQTFTRKTPITYKGTIDVAKVPAKTAIVCFSRKSVYAVASHLQKKGRKVGVLYGGLPLEARKKQIEAYVDGKYDVMVVTDVIGHGINLPIDNVVFTQTDKFDGSDVRALYVWEGAQIAGRAGRFGFSEEGSVYLGEGLDWFAADKDVVRQSVLAAGGKIATDLIIDSALIAPRLSNLGLISDGTSEEVSKLLPAIYQWQTTVPKVIKDEPLSPALLNVLSNNLVSILNNLRIPTAPWSEGKVFLEKDIPFNDYVNLNEIWQLASGPYDSNLPTINTISDWLVSPFRNESKRLKTFFNEKVYQWALASEKLSLKEASVIIENFETAVQINAELKMAMIMFGISDNNDVRRLGYLTEDMLKEADVKLNKGIVRILMMSIKNTSIGVCENCKRETKPWFKLCDSCFGEFSNNKAK